jgi:hypothetical protein
MDSVYTTLDYTNKEFGLIRSEYREALHRPIGCSLYHVNLNDELGIEVIIAYVLRPQLGSKQMFSLDVLKALKSK